MPAIRNTIIALAVLCAATLSAAPRDVSAAVCTGDSAPAGAIWSSCLTVGVWDPPPGKIGGDVGYHSGLSFGSLSTTQFTNNSISYTAKILNLWYSRFYVQITPDPGSAANNWVLHLGDDVALSFSDAEAWTWSGGRAVGGYRWKSPGFSWTSDNENDKISISLTSVASNNEPTVANPIPDQFARVGRVFSYTFPENTFSDADNHDLGYAAVPVYGSVSELTYAPVPPPIVAFGPLPEWLSFDASSRTFSGTPSKPTRGPSQTLRVRVTAYDGHGGSVGDTFSIGTGSRPPRRANRIPRQTLTAGEPFSYTFPENTFHDPDGDTLTYRAYRYVDHRVGAVWPSWLSFDASTRTFSGTPLQDDVGFYNVTVVASDGYEHFHANRTETFVIRVHQKVTGRMTILSDENARLDGVSPRHPLGPVRMFANSLLETIIPVAHADEGTCELTVGIRFTDSDGSAVAVDSLSASDLSVENGQISNLAEHGDGWRVTLTSHVGFSGVMRLRILPREPADIPDGDEALAELSDEDLLIWDEAELVVRVSDGNCERVVTTGSALTGVTVFDSADDSELGQVPNGGSISLEEGGSYSFRADVEPDSDVGSVVLSLDAPDNDDDVDRTDDDAPYTVDAQSLSAGTYTLTATAYAGDGGEGAVRGTVVATIEIAEAGVLTGFVLVDASNDTDLGAVTSGATVEVSADGSYGIRAGVEAGAEVGSVVLSLAGPGADDTHTQTENLAPYSLYGDAQGAEHGRGLAAGTYTLSATAYAERGGTGEELGTLSVAFTVAIETAPPPSSGVLTGFVLVDASDQSTVAALSSGSAIDLGGRSGGSFGIRAKVASGEAIGSVALSLSGAKTVSRTENLAPYSLYGDHNDGNGGRALDGSSLPAGSYTLSATAYAGRGASGSTLGTRSVSFRVLAPAALSVADARAEEGTDATLDFAVTLDRSSTGTVTVDYATADGTATAGDDYTATSGTLTFSAGETAKTVSVTVVDDGMWTRAARR